MSENQIKKRPTWATIIGILGIIFASFGILGAGQTMMMPKMIDFQKQMFSEMYEQEEVVPQEKPIYKDERTEPESIPPKAIFKSMEKMWDVPEWYNTWSVATGLLQLLICGFYLFASIRLLQLKTNSIKLFYYAVGSKIAHGVINGIVGIAAASFMVMSMMFWSAFGVVIDVVLLIVVATGDKKAFL